MDRADGGSLGSVRVFPALGFDPAEGDIAQVQAVLLDISSTAQVIGTTVERLKTATEITDDAEWGGDAAEEFSDHGDDLPLGLAAGAKALAVVSDALATWAEQLTANQRSADELERRAKQLRAELAEAQNAASEADQTLHDSADSQAATQARDAQQRVSAVSGALDQVLAEAERLKEKHARQADEAAEQIRAREDGGFEVENDNWFVQTVDITAEVADWTSIATGSAAAALAATGVLLPAAGVLGLTSTAAGAVGTGASVLQQVSGSSNAPGWSTIAVTTAFGYLPVGATVTAGVRSGARAALARSAEESFAIARSEIRAALRSGGLSGLRDDLADLREYGFSEAARRELRDSGHQLARRHDLEDRLPTDPIERARTLEQLGVAHGRAEALADLAGQTESALDKAGVELTPEQERRLLILQLGLDPSEARLDSVVGDGIEDKLHSQLGEGR